MTACNDDLIEQKLSWDHVGACCARCNETGMTDAAAWQWEAPPRFNRKTIRIHPVGTASVDGETTPGQWRWLGGDQ